jgi:hypothetical protein
VRDSTTAPGRISSESILLPNLKGEVAGTTAATGKTIDANIVRTDRLNASPVLRPEKANLP